MNQPTPPTDPFQWAYETDNQELPTPPVPLPTGGSGRLGGRVNEPVDQLPRGRAVARAALVAGRRPRSRASARAAGSSFERVIADYLHRVLEPGVDRLDRRVDRRPRLGAKDRGDIAGVRVHGQRVTLECKCTAKLDLPAAAREAAVERGNDDALAGVVVHKRHGVTDPGSQWVTMELRELVALLTGARVDV